MKHPKHCSECGTAYLPSQIWPKTCPNTSCGHQVWDSPKPVSIALCGTADRLLLIKRNIQPGRGLWAIPGGYVEPEELPEVGAHREAREETEKTEDQDGQPQVTLPGLTIPPEMLEPFSIVGRPELNLILLLYHAPKAAGLIEAWWEQAKDLRGQHEVWNTEVQDIVLASADDIATLQIAFSSHEDAIKRWFEKRR